VQVPTIINLLYYFYGREDARGSPAMVHLLGLPDIEIYYGNTRPRVLDRSTI